jgi:hypothetical protein
MCRNLNASSPCHPIKKIQQHNYATENSAAEPLQGLLRLVDLPDKKMPSGALVAA